MKAFRRIEEGMGSVQPQPAPRPQKVAGYRGWQIEELPDGLYQARSKDGYVLSRRFLSWEDVVEYLELSERQARGIAQDFKNEALNNRKFRRRRQQ